MNYCPATRTAWIAPVRCATRATAEVLRHLGFENAEAGEPLTDRSHSHALRLPCGDVRKILVSVRNPYARMASVWLWATRNAQTPFAAWLASPRAAAPHVRIADALAPLLTDRPPGSVHLLRTERLASDLLAVPQVREAAAPRGPVAAAFQRSVAHNRYLAVQDFTVLYTAETRAAVLDACRDEFALFGYDPEFPGSPL